MSLSAGLRHRLSLATEGKGESGFFGVDGGIQTGPALARKWKPHELSVVSVLVSQAQPHPIPCVWWVLQVWGGPLFIPSLMDNGG